MKHVAIILFALLFAFSSQAQTTNLEKQNAPVEVHAEETQNDQKTPQDNSIEPAPTVQACLLYTSDAADE